MVVQHNMQAANANRMLNVTTSAQFLLAYPPRRTASCGRIRLRSDRYLGWQGGRNQGWRCGVVPAGYQALARRFPHDSHDAYGAYRYEGRQERHLDGRSQRPAVQREIAKFFRRPRRKKRGRRTGASI